MLSGVEIASFVLATFPLVLSALEQYENGFEQMKNWYRFRKEFEAFLNALARQKIFFRQNIEELLSPIVSSEFEIAQPLDNPEGKLWSDKSLEEGLRSRLPGPFEYECYMSTVESILELLESLKQKLKIKAGKPHWTEVPATSGKMKLEYEFKKFSFTLGKKRREKIMQEFEKYNQDMQTLLGNSDKLEPMRKTRKSPITKYFQLIRRQASNLDTALTYSWQCNCRSLHSTKLLLDKRAVPSRDGTSSSNDPLSIKFNLFFCPEPHSGANSPYTLTSWEKLGCTDIKMMEFRSVNKLQQTGSMGPEYGISLEILSQQTSHGSRKGSTISDREERESRIVRKVSFADDDSESRASSVLHDAVEIDDLCSTLKKRQEDTWSTGYLKYESEGSHAVNFLDISQLPTSRKHRIVTLEAILMGLDSPSNLGGDGRLLPRRTRLSIAVTLAHSMLQLHTSPWLNETWGKRDIYFLQSHDGHIHSEHPFVIYRFESRNHVKSPQERGYQQSIQRTTSQMCNKSLLSLGILILELWFSESIETQPFRKEFLGPTGKENEYTDFNTAQKWQERALEEAGLDLHSATRRCIYCAFGAVSQDLEDEELRKAIYEGVIQPLERLQARFEEVLV